MSHHLNYRCVDHDPAIESDSISTHLHELESCIQDLTNRARIVEQVKTISDVGLSIHDLESESPTKRERMFFLSNHPHCKTEIWCEYGDKHYPPATGDTIIS